MAVKLYKGEKPYLSTDADERRPDTFTFNFRRALLPQAFAHAATIKIFPCLVRLIQESSDVSCNARAFQSLKFLA
jgi:hypothetical protein